MFENAIKLSECSMGAMSAVFVTETERYKGVYSTVNNLRLSLLHNKNFRKPYLDLLKTLYSNEGRGLPNVKHIPAKPPTDMNIRQYFDEEWPEIRLVPDTCDGDGFIWGFTNVGRDSVDENRVHVKLSLVRYWQEMSETSHPSVSTSELSLLFVMVVLHELGHRMMVWWSNGWCRTSNNPPLAVYAEAGNFVEKKFIGNDIGGWWRSKQIGKFKDLKHIGIDYNGESKVFDQMASCQALEAMMDFSRKLPLLDLSVIPTSNTVKLFRSKSCLKLDCGGNGADDNPSADERRRSRRIHNGKIHTPSQQASAASGQYVWVPIRNDAIERRH